MDFTPIDSYHAAQTSQGFWAVPAFQRQCSASGFQVLQSNRRKSGSPPIHVEDADEKSMEQKVDLLLVKFEAWLGC